jgi:hypothetical protein
MVNHFIHLFYWSLARIVSTSGDGSISQIDLLWEKQKTLLSSILEDGTGRYDSRCF